MTTGDATADAALPGVASPLDDPVRAALQGPHAHLARRFGDALAYPADVSPFAAPPRDAAGWADLAVLVGDGEVVLAHLRSEPPAGWVTSGALPGVQMVDDRLGGGADGGADGGVDAAPEAQAVRLGAADVPEMLALVAATRPGPFLDRTIALGSYLGIRDGGRLVAMAGERLRPPGYTEVSAVCTDPAYRGRGLAARLVRAVAAGVRARGETPFLHAAADNVAAIRLYERLGFRLRTRTPFVAVRAQAIARQAPGRLQRTP